MKVKKSCATCDSNYPCGCPLPKHEKCKENEMEYYEPCTNLEYLQSLSAEEFAEWMEQCKCGKGVAGLLCKDLKPNCAYSCKHERMCENANGYTDTGTIVVWLNCHVEVEE